MVNEYLADALFHAGVMNDFINLPADVKSAASPRGNPELLLVNHGIKLLLEHSGCIFRGEF